MMTFRDLVNALDRRRAKLAPLTPATRYRVAAVLREIGSLPLNADVDDFLDWIGRLQAKNAAPATVSGQIVTALALAREARSVLRDKIPPHDVPVEQLEIVRDFARKHHVSGPSQPRHRSATSTEIHALITAAQARRGDIRMELIIPFAIATALRRSEICRITWGDFDPKTSTLLVRRRKHPKNPTDQRVPLSPAALAILRELGPGDPASRIFPYHPMALTNAFTAIREKTGVQNLNFKDFRSTAAQRLFNRGWSADQVAGVTGHKNLAILLAHYASAEPERLALRLASEENTKRNLH